MKFLISKIFDNLNIKIFQFFYFYKRTLIYRKLLEKITKYSSREDLFDNLIKKEDEIQIIEFGVFIGYSLNYFSKLNINSKSKFFGFDSFEGLSDEWNYGFMGGKKKGYFKLDDDNKLLNFNDNRVTLIKGYFNKTLRQNLKLFSKNQETFVHFDADLYSSTLFCLTTLHNHFDNYIAIFDEFPMHECSALHDYISSYNVNIKFLACTKDKVRVACRIECR
jgi:O-methyltransferase